MFDVAYANRSTSRCVSVPNRRQCHDLVRIPARADYLGAKWAHIHDPRNAVIIGPADTPFEDGTFRLVMHFEEQYPNKPPGVKFISQMFHPNVYGTGELCLDILQNRWSPTYDVAAILTSIQRHANSCEHGIEADHSRLAYLMIPIPPPLPTSRHQTFTRTTAEST